MQVPFSFSGRLEPTRLSLAYRLGLVVVALAMLLLPLAYLGLIALAGAGVWWHLTHNAWILRGDAVQWRVLGYAAPAIAGGAITFFMVKPVLATHPMPEPPLPILPSEEPVLFAFVEQICRQVGAPVPRRVQVDCQVNASAGFIGGWRGLIRRDLVLTIGLPLVAGLSVRELGGVLAHEFGHFAQGSGLRLTTVVRSVNGWFARVVYERDHWDGRLERWSRDSDWRFQLLMIPSRFAVWLSRLVLRGLMVAGHAISCFMMRQMEYDADSYEIKLSGSPAFASTMFRLRELNLASVVCSQDLRGLLATGKLPSDLPVFLVARLRGLSDDVVRQAREVSEQAGGYFDTHPTDAERLRAAETAAASGIFVGDDSPALQLFHAFGPVSARATRHHYEHRAGLPSDAFTLIDTFDAVRVSVDREARARAFGDLFADGLSRYRPLVIHDAVHESDDTGRTDRTELSSSGSDVAERYRRFEQLTLQRYKAFAAQELLQAGFHLPDPSTFGLDAWTLEAAATAEAAARTESEELARSLADYEESATRRLARGITRGGGAGENAALVAAFNAASGAMLACFDLERLVFARHMLDNLVQATATTPEARERHAGLTAGMGEAWDRMRRAVHGVPAPPAVSVEGATLEECCGLSSVALPDDLSEPAARTERLYNALLHQLCWIASQGEAHTPVRRSGA